MKSIHNLIEMCWDDKKPKGSDLRAAERELERIVEALAVSEPWDKYDNDLWRCIHCGGTYDWSKEVVQVGHKADCIWLAVQDDEQVENEEE